MSRSRFLSSKEANELHPPVNEAGQLVCRWCRKLLPQSNRRYCSSDCRQELWMRMSGASVRFHLEKRDHGVCAICERDTEWLYMTWMYHLRGIWAHRQWRELGRRLSGGNNPTQSWWEADHVNPVIKGGGACGLDNYRTLCIPCHHRVTADLARERAIERRDAKAELFTTQQEQSA